MKKVFIAATKQNDGKTTVSLGLIRNLQDRFKRVGFIKPIGQRYLEEEGLKFDEDSWLIEEACGIKAGLKDMSPIAVEKGFTEKYISHPDKKSITSRIKQAFKRVSKASKLVIIEGTGHAGVGSVFDHSNAAVARLLGAKVIIVSSGGIGRPIDEIVLNKALFDREGVKVLGVIINKVLPSKFDKISSLVRAGLKRKGIDILGIIPYVPLLAEPTIAQILEETDFQLLCGKACVERSVSRVIVGAMEPKAAISYISENSLIITPGNRKDMIMAVLSCFSEKEKNKLKIAGIVLSGGIMPEQRIMDMLVEACIPILLAKYDTYTVATYIHDLIIKIQPQNTAKINAAVKLVKDNVNLDKILKGM